MIPTLLAALVAVAGPANTAGHAVYTRAAHLHPRPLLHATADRLGTEAVLASLASGVDVYTLLAVAEAESRYDASVASRCCRGWMQLDPRTAQAVADSVGIDRCRPVAVAAMYLRLLLRRYRGRLAWALTAYNRGPAGFERTHQISKYAHDVLRRRAIIAALFPSTHRVLLIR